MEPTYDARSRIMLQLSPNIRRAWNHKVDHMKMKPRIIFDYELLYLEKGELTVSIEDELHELKPGDIVLFKPGKEHEFLHSVGECVMPHIHFDVLHYEDFEEVPIYFKTLPEGAEEARFLRPDVLGRVFGIPDVLRIGNHGEVHKLLLQIIHAYERRDPEFAILQKSLVLRIIYLVLKGLEANANPSVTLRHKSLEAAFSHIIEHYNEPVRLEELAKIACLSVYHFSRLFKLKYGQAPHQLQMRHRIEKAKEFMIYSPLSMTAIAERVGYGSVFAFSKAFKQMEGVSPTQFMKSFFDGAPPSAP